MNDAAWWGVAGLLLLTWVTWPTQWTWPWTRQQEAVGEPSTEPVPARGRHRADRRATVDDHVEGS